MIAFSISFLGVFFVGINGRFYIIHEPSIIGRFVLYSEPSIIDDFTWIVDHEVWAFWHRYWAFWFLCIGVSATALGCCVYCFMGICTLVWGEIVNTFDLHFNQVSVCVLNMLDLRLNQGLNRRFKHSLIYVLIMV